MSVGSFVVGDRTFSVAEGRLLRRGELRRGARVSRLRGGRVVERRLKQGYGFRMANLWLRAKDWFPTRGKTRLHFAIFARNADLPRVDPALDGLPSGSESVPLVYKVWEDPTDVHRFVGHTERPVATYGTVDRARLLRRVVWQVHFEGPDLPDCLCLQTALAFCHSLARQRWTLAIYDLITGALWEPAVFASLDPARPLDIGEHLTSIFSLDPTTGRGWCNSRGLAKFGRHDYLMRGLDPQRHDHAASFFRTQMNVALALGKPWEPGKFIAAVLHGPRGELPEVTFVPPPPELRTETWGNAYMEIVDLGPAGPTRDCHVVMDALAAQLR